MAVCHGKRNVSARMRNQKKQALLQRRRWRIRRKVQGTSERPRMSVRMTQQHIYVQFIDDEAGHTLAAVSSRGKDVTARDKLTANVAGAEKIGKLAGQTAIDKGISSVVFDRGWSRYHGKVKALADAARTTGLKF